ncbi:cytidylate kinase-like family protein [Novispirillum itersonii]|uniref:Cytidylate kinase n=1 Tax=Novispirillum itersonii TaxID=189 RepID=A0A7W9ZCF3_NOVIT|nr:cytidylate kinase-like family protein [Novispirillum itersonii]MBB6208898.1 cytidylate kinase [Novispirillum itersonii]
MTTLHSAMQALMMASGLPGDGGLIRPPKPVIAISRDHGALGRQIAVALSKRLDIPVYDREILDHIAKRLETDPATLKQLDESNARARDMWLMRLFTGKDLSEDAYRRCLIDVVLSLARVGGIILGRGSNVILSTSCALRLRVTASPDVCARRVAARYGVSLDDARQQIETINHNRGRFVWELFHARNSDATTFDMVLNTDRIDDPDKAVDSILAAYTALAEASTARLSA